MENSVRGVVGTNAYCGYVAALKLATETDVRAAIRAACEEA